MYKEFAEVYDYLAEKKDYKKEVLLCRDYLTDIPKTILDIGCGTGSHLKEFANFNPVYSVGVDPCDEMIAVAKKKNIPNCTLHVGEVYDIEEDHFDLVTCLFNVINHISDYKILKKTFKSIYYKLNDGASFIFDCWNGVAFFMDPPKAKATVTSQGTYSYEPTIDYLNSNILMKVSLHDDSGKVVSSKLSHTLWTPYFLKSLLLDTGFSVVIIKKLFSEKDAVGDEHQLTFICKKL